MYTYVYTYIHNTYINTYVYTYIHTYIRKIRSDYFKKIKKAFKDVTRGDPWDKSL